MEKNILKSNSLHWSAAKSFKTSHYDFFKVNIHCYLAENAKFNIRFRSRFCSSECIPTFALHKCCAKCKQPVKQGASHRNKQAFHFLHSFTASAFYLPVFSSARFPFRLLSKANWLNSRFSVKEVLRCYFFKLDFTFFIIKTRTGTGAFNNLSSVYKPFNLYYPFLEDSKNIDSWY